MKPAGLFSILTLFVVTVVGVAYIATSVLSVDPTRSTYDVTVTLPTTGGLQPDADVLVRGVPVGSIVSMHNVTDGVTARLRLDTSPAISADSTFRVTNLSALGEQFLEIDPGTSGARLHGGAVIPPAHVVVPVTAGELIERLSELTGQLDVGRLRSILATFTEGTAGRTTDIATLSTSVHLLAGTLDNRRDEVRNIYRNVQQLISLSEGSGPKLSSATGPASTATPALSGLIDEFVTFANVSAEPFEKTLTPAINKLLPYLTTLLPDFTKLSAPLLPTLREVRGIRVNVGSITDLLLQTFPDDGVAQVIVGVPR